MRNMYSYDFEMDTEKQRQHRCDDARLTESGNARIKQLNTRGAYRVANQQSLACLSVSERRRPGWFLDMKYQTCFLGNSPHSYSKVTLVILNSGVQPLSCSIMVLSFSHSPQPHPRNSPWGSDEASSPCPALVIVEFS